MNISFFKPNDFDGNLKATIHASGKLGFTDAAIKKFEITEKKGIKIGQNVNDKNDKNLYVLFTDEVDEESFRINKAGAYYYVNTRPLFDAMQIQYRTKRITFDIIPLEIEGNKVYKFLYREKNRTDEKENNTEE